MNIENKIKLSDKQKEIIELMRDGYILSANTIATSYNPVLKRADKTIRYYKMGSISSLLTKGLITHAEKHYMGTHFYALTDLGATVSLEPAKPQEP